MPEAAARAFVGEPEPTGPFRVLPENWEAVRVFVALSTQWRLAPMGGPVGLDNAAIPPTLMLMGIGRKRWAEIFERLMVMEGAAIGVMRGRAT